MPGIPPKSGAPKVEIARTFIGVLIVEPGGSRNQSGTIGRRKNAAIVTEMGSR